MANIVNNEEVLCSINSYRDVKTSSSIANFFTNLFTGGVAGGVVSNFKLTLTSENLYIQAIEHVAWGGLPEILYTEKISRGDIKSFEVKNQEAKEFITIIAVDNKKIDLIRDNGQSDDLASVMAMFISNDKEN